MRTPSRVLFQILGDAHGEQNVSGIAAIHHSLRDVDAGPRDIGLFVQVNDFVDRPAVNSHAHMKFGMTFQRFTDF